ncbi:MAG: DUF1294 domain-containing protein [Planctomycetota bacterium]
MKRPVRRFLGLGVGVAAAIGMPLAVYAQWHPLLAHLVGVNASTLLLFGYDKAVAGGTWTRVPERVLHLFAFAGGTPATLLARKLFRHKTLKSSFKRTFAWVIVGQIVLLRAAWYLLASR